MIVTVICDVLGEENNGTTIACMNLIRALKKRGHTVRVVCMDRNMRGREGWYIVPELNLGGAANHIIHRNGVALAKPDRAVLEDAIKDCDLVHTTFVFGLSQTAVKIAKKYGKPVTSSFHCQAENVTAHFALKDSPFVNREIYHWFYRRIFKYSDCIHYPTQFIRDVFETTVGPTNGAVISNGVNAMFRHAPQPKPPELKNKFVILSIGRLSGEKNHEILIKAAAASKYRQRLHIIIAGEGPREQYLINLAKKLGVELEIKFFPRMELVKVINSADLYVHPAEVEIESIACLEAICCGLVPVIADSPKSAARYFALDKSCLFANKNDGELKERMDFWIENPELKAEYSARYLRTAHRFDHEECMDRMEKMMLSTARSKGDEDYAPSAGLGAV